MKRGSGVPDLAAERPEASGEQKREYEDDRAMPE